MKKALIVSSVASMIDQFNIPNILLLIELGYSVDVACNFVAGNTCNKEKINILRQRLEDLNVGCFQVDFARNVWNVKQNLKAYHQIRNILYAGKYDLVHSHSPIGGLLSRVAARNLRKNGTKVIYTAHGFHFYKGAPPKNWLIFYPIEVLCSYITDTLITITKEDYSLACRKMHAGTVLYVPGVGIDVAKYRSTASSEVLEKIRSDMGIGENDRIILSVGELNKNKNHEVVLRALAKFGRRDIHYVIAGQGSLKEYLENLAAESGLSEQLHLLGFRSDVKDIYQMADVYAHPSFREGLSVAVMEAMASGLPVICSRIRGNSDLIDEGKGGCLFDPKDVEDVYLSMRNFFENADNSSLGSYNRGKAEGLDTKVIMDLIKPIYS